MFLFMRRVCVTVVLSAACFSAVGCGKPVQVIVPDDFHGDLVVHCTSTGTNSLVLHADSNGVADGVCPSVETGVQVFRAGQQVLISGSPGWTLTRDGIPTAVRIDVY